jgi:hypothetical protein
MNITFNNNKLKKYTNDDGQYLWIEIKGVEIIEIEDYH